jgi:uncharacterized protein YbbC (DUF1343 family)
MTIGEYAKMVNEEGWLKDRMICDLQVIPMENYTHQTQYALPVSPSPNLKDMNAVYLYPSLCLFEGTIISVGRGTTFPFEVYGHPSFKGFSFDFTPKPLKGGTIPLYNEQLCRGIDLRGFYKTHPRLFGRLNLTWLIMAFKSLGSDPHFFNDSFDRLAGTSDLRKQIIDDKNEQEIRLGWQEGLEKFKEIRKKYLLYPE